MVLEVGLIDLQRWRGVASHFNNTSALETGIYNLMAVLIIVSVSAIGVLGWRLFRSVEVARDTRLSGALGVAYLLLGSVVGGAISVRAAISYGVLFVAALVQTLLGRAPDDPAPVTVALTALGLLLLLPPVLDLFELRASVRAIEAV